MSEQKYKKVGAVTAASVQKATKKDWDYWINTLNKNNCRSLSHQELVHLLKTKYKLKPWWQQEVARGYQIALGLRIPQQTLKGTYTTTATKTIPLSAAKVFKFMLSPKGQEIWLQSYSPIEFQKGYQFECPGGIYGEVRTVGTGTKLRLAWNDENWERKSTVQVHVYPKSKTSCMIVVNHDDLPTLKDKAEIHDRWRRAVDELAKAFASR